MIHPDLMEMKTFEGPGYLPLVDFDTWRVAFLRFIDDLIPENITRMERHVETDEVFVLLKGQAVLFLGEGDEHIEKIHAELMQPGVLYNVRRNGWHVCTMSKESTILLVENRDTGPGNTDYLALSPEQLEMLVSISHDRIPDLRGS